MRFELTTLTLARWPTGLRRDILGFATDENYTIKQYVSSNTLRRSYPRDAQLLASKCLESTPIEGMMRNSKHNSSRVLIWLRKS